MGYGPIALPLRHIAACFYFCILVSFCILFFSFYCSLYLRSDSWLQVVLVEVSLEVEVGELFAFRDAEELLEGCIRLDVMLGLQVLLLDVVVHCLGDLRAGHEGTIGLAEEVAELVGDGSWALEDGRSALDLNAVLISLDATLSLSRILDLSVDTLLESLDLAEEGGDSLTHGGEVASHRLDVLLKCGGRGRCGRGLGGRGRDRGHNDRGRGCDDRGDDLGLGSLGLHDLLLSSWCNRHKRRNRGFNNRRSGNLCSDLLSDLRGRRRAHYTSSRGIRRRHFTHYHILGDTSASIFELFC
jgi:hypothetical protein